MGGPGPGHKSERARLARLVNMAKARAARKREPLRWRSGLESRIIEQLVWQWWVETGGEWLVASARKNQMHDRPVASVWKNQVQTRKAPRSQTEHPSTLLRTSGAPSNPPSSERAGHPPAGKPAYAKASAGRPWAKQRVARFLDVSHTWVNKLVKRFEADPDRMRRRMAACAPASFEKLERAREETRRQRKFGWIRGPIRMRRVKWTLGGKAQRAVVWTHSEKRRREEARRGQQGPPSVSYADLPAWARGAV
jgi:hypothetical protein